MLDTSSASVLFVTDCVSSSRSPVISLSVRTCPTRPNLVDKNGSESAFSSEIVFVLTRDAQMVLMDCSTGNMIGSQPTHPNEKSVAINMYLLGKCAPCTYYHMQYFRLSYMFSWVLNAEDQHHQVEWSKSVSSTYSQHTEAQSEALHTTHQNQSGLANVEEVEPNLEYKMLPSQILLCCEEAFYIYPSQPLIQVLAIFCKYFDSLFNVNIFFHTL